MFEEISGKLAEWIGAIDVSTSLIDLEKIKAGLVGKNGIITLAFKRLATLAGDEKKSYGDLLNKVKDTVEETCRRRMEEIKKSSVAKRLADEHLDITLPSVTESFGGVHVLTKTIRRIRDHYHSRGFLVLDGPEIEKEFFNFDALNIPKHHPARQSHDTFYFNDFDDALLRTHTSCVQVRTMMQDGLPVRMISIGKTYRNDQLDATHSPMFHQVEGLVVDKCGVTIGHLKSELKKFVSVFFENDDVEIRLRPSYFPFTEPGVEVDCRYTKEGGKLTLSKKGEFWVELAGAGMVHPKVFEICGIKGPAQGFAFGFGLERLLMLRKGIADIRNIYDTDSRILKHYHNDMR